MGLLAACEPKCSMLARLSPIPRSDTRERYVSQLDTAEKVSWRAADLRARCVNSADARPPAPPARVGTRRPARATARHPIPPGGFRGIVDLAIEEIDDRSHLHFHDRNQLTALDVAGLTNDDFLFA